MMKFSKMDNHGQSWIMDFTPIIIQLSLLSRSTHKLKKQIKNSKITLSVCMYGVMDNIIYIYNKSQTLKFFKSALSVIIPHGVIPNYQGG